MMTQYHNIAFAIPKTPLIRVEYTRDGVKQYAVIPNPKDNNGLQRVMLARKVSMRQIQHVLPIEPRPVTQHGVVAIR